MIANVERIPIPMVTRILFTLAIAGMMVIGTGGCSSATHPGALAPTSTPALTPTPLRALRAGDGAPDFALDTLDGTRKVHLSDFRGKAILLLFWAITCSPCVKELPLVQRFYARQQAAGKDFVILAVDIDQIDEFVKVARLQQQLGLTYPILVDDHFYARVSYQVTDVPIFYFIDRQGLIHSILSGSLDDATLLKAANDAER